MSANNRIYNFSAGPSMLPLPVLEQAAREMIDYRACGMSVMELSHRSKEFENIIETAEADLRELMDIPQSYKVLFLQGGGYLQFSMIAMNLFHKSGQADYVITGSWSKNAAKEAAKLGKVNVVASSEGDNFTYIPKWENYKDNCSKDADYLHITYNNTIYGTRYTEIPQVEGVPLVSDLSSMILSEELDINKFGLVYAGAQKNIGPAGVTIVIARDDLIGLAPEGTPSMLNYKTHADAKSLFNTPPCYSIYMAGLTFKWVKDQGGVKAIQKINEKKASLLYDAIDNSSLFSCPVAKEDRSLMNVVFVTGDESLDKKFIAEGKEKGFANLGGHRSIGGMRASIYNAMPIEGVEALIDYMNDFERKL